MPDAPCASLLYFFFGGGEGDYYWRYCTTPKYVQTRTVVQLPLLAMEISKALVDVGLLETKVDAFFI